MLISGMHFVNLPYPKKDQTSGGFKNVRAMWCKYN